MKRLVPVLVFLGLLVFIIGSSPISTAFQIEVDGDQRPTSRLDRVNIAVEKSDELFLEDSRGELDQYLFRTDGDGYLRFPIAITRYYFNENDEEVKFNNGFLGESSVQHLVENHILPETATLFLRVFDVDEDASDCPEVDHIWVNNRRIEQNGQPVKLSGFNESWSDWDVQIPIDVLKFPQAKGSSGRAPTPVDNEIAVQIDVSGCTKEDGTGRWAVAVDYGYINIPSPVRPIIFAYGWTGSDNDFNKFEEWMAKDGIPSAGKADLREGIYPISATAAWLMYDIFEAANEYGVDKLNIFAHSKGGLVARQALEEPTVSLHTENVVTYASPHHGTLMATEDVLEAKCSFVYFFDDEKKERCESSGQEFSISRMRAFNYSGCTQSTSSDEWENCTLIKKRKANVNYYSIAASNDEAVFPVRTTTFPWVAWETGEIPFPEEINVNKEIMVPTINGFPHSGLLKVKLAYECGLQYLGSEIYKNSDCSPSEQQIGAKEHMSGTSMFAKDNYQRVLSEGGTLTSGSKQTIKANIDGGSIAVFDIYSDELVDFALTDPSGRLINQSIANSDPNITYLSGFSDQTRLQRYLILNPVEGNWDNIVQANDNINYLVLNQTNSKVQLIARTDQAAYRPGDLVTVESALIDGSSRFNDVTIQGTVKQPDGSETQLIYYDDGSNGDSIAYDGIYTAQFVAGSTNGHAVVEYNGTMGNVIRKAETTVPIAAQTAISQLVTDENPEDTNGNGLYDDLIINLKVNVVKKGHFEFQGTLIDKNGETVTLGYYSTVMAGAGLLPEGNRSIVLNFDGSEIHEHGVDGPYTLTDLIINDITDAAVQVDVKENIYVTEGYDFESFERPMIILEGGRETAIDSDNNGRYDSLEIDLDVDVVKSGSYELNGRLVDPNGKEIAWSGTSFYAADSGSFEASLVFDGREIGENEVDGPYALRNLSIFNADGSAGAIITDAYETKAYSVTEFEGGVARVYMPAVMGVVAGPPPANRRPNIPSGPLPNDGATNQNIQVDLYWSGGDPDGDSVTYDVKFEAGDTLPDTIVCDDSSSSSCDLGLLDYGTKYYWQVIAEDEHGLKSSGPVWHFTTEPENNPPYVPNDPSPGEGATNQSVNTGLSWSGGDPDRDSVTYDVYLESGNSTPGNLECADTNNLYCYPSGLNYETKYYWQVVARDEHGETTEGPVWSFTTEDDEKSWQAVGSGSASGGGISNNGGDSGFPTVAVSPGNSTPFVAWQDNSGGDYEIYVRSWNGSSWIDLGGSASGGGISQNGGVSEAPYVAVSGNNTAYVTWQDDSSGRYQVYLKYWNGSSWQQLGGSGSGGGLSGSSSIAREPSVAIGANGRPYVAYRDKSSGNFEVYLKYWNGSSWQPVGGSASGGGISGTSGYSGRPIVATAANGAICVSWQDSTPGDQEIYVRCWSGSSWVEYGGSASGGGISNNGGVSVHSTMALNSNGRPYVAWYDNSSGDDEIYMKYWNGSSWAQLSSSASGGGVSNNGGSSIRPFLDLDANDRPHLAWQDSSGGDNEIYTKYWNGSSWTLHQSGSASSGGISANSGSSERPSLSFGPNGIPYAAWMDFSAGDGEIYVKRWN